MPTPCATGSLRGCSVARFKPAGRESNQILVRIVIGMGSALIALHKRFAEDIVRWLWHLRTGPAVRRGVSAHHLRASPIAAVNAMLTAFYLRVGSIEPSVVELYMSSPVASESVPEDHETIVVRTDPRCAGEASSSHQWK
jgi:hypothetical protein